MLIAVSTSADTGIKFWGEVSQKYDDTIDSIIGTNLRLAAIEKP